MLIENLENKVKLVRMICLAVIAASAVVTCIAISETMATIRNQNKKIYLLDSSGIPYAATQTDDEYTYLMGAKDHIRHFHEYFFNLSSDEGYIGYTIKKSLYFIDKSGMQQYKNLKEKGFYDNIIATTTTTTCICDSININPKDMSFVFYGKQIFRRPSSISMRHLITKGYITNTKKSENNPHGMIISSWRIVSNIQLDKTEQSKIQTEQTLEKQ